MKFLDLCSQAGAVLRAKYLRVKTPLIVGWAVTARCNKRCAYCGFPRDEDELSTGEAVRVIREMAGLGTRVISFTGGEPLLREDLGALIAEATRFRIAVRLNSNGALVPDKIGMLALIKKLTISFDGPEEAHDSVRGSGSYREALAAAREARAAGIPVDFCCVISRKNLTHLEFVAARAKEYGARVLFQVATRAVLGRTEPNALSPEREEFMAAVDTLAELKKRYANIMNSAEHIRSLRSWPAGGPFVCASSLISCRIQPNGDVVHCSRETFRFTPLNAVRDGFGQAFRSLPAVRCGSCWCAGRRELNYLLELRFDAIRTALRGI